MTDNGASRTIEAGDVGHTDAVSEALGPVCSPQEAAERGAWAKRERAEMMRPKADGSGMHESFYVTYLFTDKLGQKFPRRSGPFGDEAARSLAKEWSRREEVSEVVVERWACVSKEAVS